MKNPLLKALPLLFLFAVAGCEQEGPAESAGEQIDETTENVGDRMEEATEEARENTNQ